MFFFVYALHSPSSNKIYIGQTSNLKRRFGEHNLGLSKFTKSYTPWNLIYYEKHFSRSDAMKRERELKSHQGRNFIRNITLSGQVMQLPKEDSC